MSIPKKLNAFNAEITKLCAPHEDFLQLLDELIATKPASRKIPNNWKTLNDVPKEKTFVGHHPKNTENEMVFLSSNHIAGREVYIVGDLHADKKSLDAILLQTRFFKKDLKPFLIFLGDYFDRGLKSFETISSILLLKKHFPDCVFPLRGNHENAEIFVLSNDNPFYILQQQGYDKNQQQDILEKIKMLLPLAATFDETLCLHGGFGTKNPKKINDIIEDADNVTWSSSIMYRGAGLFVPLQKMLQQAHSLGFKVFVKGHEHENKTEKGHNDIKAYVLLSTGQGSDDACEGYKKIKRGRPSLLKYDQTKGFQRVNIRYKAKITN